MPRPSTAGRPSQVDRAMALRDVVQHAVSTEQEYRKKTGVQQSNARLVAMILLLVPLLGFSAWAWITKPAFIWGAPPVMTTVQQEANLKVTLYILGMRLNKYRAAQGFYPASLDVLGENAPGVSYELVSDSIFELRGVAGRQPVVYRSDMNSREYLGNAKDLITGRATR